MANDSDIISYITKNRSFIDYVREIKRVSGLDIRDIVIEAALEKDRANFFDLGCGYGYASLDFFNVLEERCLQKRVNPDILQNVNYYGFDLFVKPVENKDRRTHFAYPKDICDSFEGFPELSKFDPQNKTKGDYSIDLAFERILDNFSIYKGLFHIRGPDYVYLNRGEDFLGNERLFEEADRDLEKQLQRFKPLIEKQL